MESRTFQLLEFPKVLRALSALAVSPAGRERCLGILPFEDPARLAAETALLDQGLAWISVSGFSLAPFEPLDGLLSYIVSPTNVVDLDGLWGLQSVLAIVRDAREALRVPSGREMPELAAFFGACPWPETVWAALKRCIGADGRLKDESSPELYTVRQEIRRINQACTRKVKDFIQSQGLSAYLQDDYITISSDRYVLPLKSNFKGRLQGIIHDYSQTGETCYFEPLFLVEQNNELQDLKREEREEERKVLAFLTGLVRQEEAAVRGAYDFLVRLDVLLAKAALAKALGGRALFPDERPGFDLRDARHPLLALEAATAAQAGGKPMQTVVPLDIKISVDEFALIISGGNAGGKTVCLKTLGLISLMSLAALPVPVAEGSRMQHWGRIFVFLGDEQSLEEHLSTFTAQVRSLARVWDQVDARSLVILDEFGAGTDPAQGAALAQAVVEALLEKGARAAVATHFPALKAYGLSRDGVRSASVMFDPASKRPLYRLAYDQVGASIALDVAREHGLPDAILARAEEYLLQGGADTSRLLDRLNTLAVERERELRELARERARLKEKEARLATRFEQEKAKLLESVKGESQAIVRSWQEGRVGRKQAQRELSQLRERLTLETPADEGAKEAAPEAVAQGMAIVYQPWGKRGTVTEVSQRSGQAKVDIGGVSLWAKISDLVPADAATVPAVKRAVSVTRAPGGAGAAPYALDVRGQRADEAVAQLARFLDRSILDGVHELEIVHGRGSGALRREVHEFLRRFPAVKSFQLAPEDQGGDGKTLVELS